MDWGELKQSQRMQIKTLICVLGILLLLLLLLGENFLGGENGGKNKKGQLKWLHIPVVETYKNVWVMDVYEDGITIFHDGKQEKYQFCKEYSDRDKIQNYREQIADITLKDGEVESVIRKTDKISGVVLGADETYVELERYGKVPLAKNYKGYRTFGSLKMCDFKDISFGYASADFVLENGKICGILLAREQAMEEIRVLIKTSEYAGLYHDEVILSGDCDLLVEFGPDNDKKSVELTAGEKLLLEENSNYFEGDRIIISPKALTGKIILENVKRSQGTPAYRGHMELITTEDGIVVVNQLPLEEYLYCVVPSEMPVSYHMEALKAQAICARTYAYGKMLVAGYPKYGAHVDDSTTYQVYNNTNERERSTTAVKETYGQLLITPEGGVAETYYYSTSCGMGSDANVWKSDAAMALTYLKSKRLNHESMESTVTALSADDGSEQTIKGGESMQEEENFKTFISGKDAEDFEVAESWYRWNYRVKKLDVATVYKALKSCSKSNPSQILTLKSDSFVKADIKEFSRIEDIYVAKRGNGGYADELIIETNKGTYKVISQYNIRVVLNDGVSKVIRQDGSEVASKTLLPSAFFVLSIVKEKDSVVGYTITGGGYGHGVGMSQNGAKAMAESGYTATQILRYFYDGCTINSIYIQN